MNQLETRPIPQQSEAFAEDDAPTVNMRLADLSMAHTVEFPAIHAPAEQAPVMTEAEMRRNQLVEDVIQSTQMKLAEHGIEAITFNGTGEHEMMRESAYLHHKELGLVTHLETRVDTNDNHARGEDQITITQMGLVAKRWGDQPDFPNLFRYGINTRTGTVDHVSQRKPHEQAWKHFPVTAVSDTDMRALRVLIDDSEPVEGKRLQKLLKRT